MLQFLRKRFASCLLSCLTIASTTMLMPMQAAAQYYYPDYQQGCCAETYCDDDCNTCCNKSFWCSPGALLLGAAVLGAGAGAAVAAGMNNGSSHHDDNPFVEDNGQTLSFVINLDISVALVGGTAIPFVSTPDGRVIEGPAVSIPLAGVLTFDPIVVSDIVFGTYTVGVQTTGGVTLTVVVPTATVTASRDGSVTTIGLITPALALTGESQVSGEFTYGPVNVP